MSTYAVLQSRVFKSPIEKVWQAWTQPELMKQWFCPLGMKAVEVDVDLRIGGAFRVVMDTNDALIQPPPEMGRFLIATGNYRLIKKPRELVFSWAWEGQDETSQVSLTFSPKGEKTVLVLEHTGLKDENSRIFHEDGWIPTLENLSQLLNVM